MGIRKAIRSVLARVALLLVIISFATPVFAYQSATYAGSYFGDADGNLSINLSDLAQHQAYMSFKPCTYDTPQNQVPGQYWNTCDVDHNASCNLSDIAILNSYTSFKPVNLGADDPWGIVNVDLPLSGNDAGVWIPFQLGLFAQNFGQKGIPGLSIRVTIDAGNSTTTGELSGRDCAGGAGDALAAAGSQCAIGVPLTNLTAGSPLGLTETNGVQLGIRGDGNGTIRLVAEVKQWTSMDIPYVSNSWDIGFGGGCNVSINCPSDPQDVNETDPLTCGISYDPILCTPGNLVKSPGDTCLGAVVTDNGDGTGSYSLPIQGETVGPDSCLAQVDIDTASDTNAINILEVNIPPNDNAPPYVSGDEMTVIGFDLFPTDADIPAQALSCEVVSNTCPGGPGPGPLPGCSWSWSTGEIDGGTVCNVVTRVFDGVDYSFDVPTTVEVIHWPCLPEVYLYCPAGVGENETALCGVVVIDCNMPPYAPVCSLNPATTCTGVSLIDCSDVFIPAQGEAAGPGSCDVVVDATNIDMVTNYGSATIVINEEPTAPVNNAPPSVSGNELTTISFNMAPTDPDIPPDVLTCELVSATGACAGGGLVGCVWQWTPGEADGPTVCSVTTRAYDGVFYSDNVTTTVTVNEVNIAPTDNAPTSISGDEGTLITFDVNPTDPDLPAQTLTCDFVASLCPGGALNGCVFEWTPTEFDGPQTCDVVTRVFDGVNYSADVMTRITVNEVNRVPIINSSCSQAGDSCTGGSVTCNYVASDPDLPPQSLIYSIAGSDTCGGMLIDNGDGTAQYTYMYGPGPSACTMAVEIADNGSPPLVAIDENYVTINDINCPPSIQLTCPASVSQGDPINCSISVFDPDLPPPPLTCSVAMDDTCGGVLTDCTSYDVASASSDCRASVNVFDGMVEANDFEDITVVPTPEVTIDCSNPGPNPVDEGSPMQCAVTYTDSFCSLLGTPGAGDTCGGTVTDLGGGLGVYDLTPAEDQGPGSCVAAVECGALSGSDSVNISEVNVPPVDNAPASLSGDEGTLITFDVNPTDPDLPAQTLTCDFMTPCTPFASMNGCVFEWTPEEYEGPQTCDVYTRVFDGVSYSDYWPTTITVNEVNLAPANNAPGLVGGDEGTLVSFDIAPTDPDSPAQTLTCSIVSNSCAGGALNGCVFEWNTTDSDGGQVCEVVTVVNDGLEDSAQVTTIVTVNDFNLPPADNAPATVNGDEGTLVSFNIAPTDPDLPAQTLTCEVVVNLCPGGPGPGPLAGCVWSWTPTEAEGPNSGCDVVTLVYDGVVNSPWVITTVSVNEVNVPPTNNAPATASGNQDKLIQFDIAPTDADIPVQTLTCDIVSNGCTGGMLNGCVFEWTPTASSPDVCDVVTEANDGVVNSAQVTTTVTVIKANRPPDFAELPTNVLAREGAPFSFTATKIDPDFPQQTLTCQIATGAPVPKVGSVVATAPGTGDDTGDSVADAALQDAGAPINGSVPGDGQYGVVRRSRMELTAFDTSAIPAGAVITGVVLNLRYGSQGGNMSNCVQFNGTDTTVCPLQTGGGWVDATGYDLFSNGINNLTAIQNLVIGYTNNAGGGGNNRSMDFDVVNLTVNYNEAGLLDTCGWGTLTDNPGVSGSTCSYDGAPPAGFGACSVTFQVCDGLLCKTEPLIISPAPPCVLSFTCPAGINENSTLTIPITYSNCFGSLAEGAIDTCPNTIVTDNGNGTGTYQINPAPGELLGPGNCAINVAIDTVSRMCNVPILEVNEPPVDNAPGLAKGDEGTLISFDIAPTDTDIPVQTLSCLIVSNSCSGGFLNGCVFEWNTTEMDGPQLCNVITRAYDGVSFSASVTTSVSVTEINVPPVNNAPATVNGDEMMPISFNVNPGDADIPPQWLTCEVVSNGCPGGPGPGPLAGCSWTWTPTEADGPNGGCSVVTRVFDGIEYSANATTTVTVNDINVPPIWSVAPTGMTQLPVNTSYNQVNGVAADTDIPLNNLTCSIVGNDCPMAITYSGSGAGSVPCNISFTTPPSNGACTVWVIVTDGSGADTGPYPIPIDWSDCSPADWVGTSVSGNLGGIRPEITRIQSNYPAEFGQVTLNFSGKTCGCSATVTCAAAGAVAVTATDSGNNCIISANAGFWPSNDTCIITGADNGAGCSGPGCGSSDVFLTALRLDECAPRGGTCGGFIDNGFYGTGNSLEIDLVDRRSGIPVAGSGGGHAYVYVEHPYLAFPNMMERFDGDDDGMITFADLDGLLSEQVNVTGAYKGASGVCGPGEEASCYRFVTMNDVDSRRIVVPMELTTVGDWALPEAQIWGYIPILGFSQYVGNRPLSNQLANPLRAAFVMTALLDQSLAAIDLSSILRSTGELSTISICSNALGINVGDIDIPANLLLPDLIRQNWNAACSGNMKMSPANTTFRLFTNRPNIQRVILAMGASVVTSNFNLYEALDITKLPITMTALGTDVINIPALPTDINMGDSGGNWASGSATPKSVPFEFDFRASGTFPTAIGSRFQMNMAGWPLDPQRVRLGAAASPPYGDPNRYGGAIEFHNGNMYILGEQMLVNGARSNAGIVPLQLKMVPMIDDKNFTVFQKFNGLYKTYTDVRPWANSSTDTQVMSTLVTGIPSTVSDTGIDWAGARYGCVYILLRGSLQNWPTSQRMMLQQNVPGRSATSVDVPSFQAVRNSVQGNVNWLPIPGVTNPANPGYVVPVQTDQGGRPINRNGQLKRGTAVSPAHNIQSDPDGKRFFTLSNPSNTQFGHRAELYEFDLGDAASLANPWSDPVRGAPDNNALWKIYGNVQARPSLTVSLPRVNPGAATLNGVSGVIPDPFEGANFVGHPLEWSLTEHIFDTSATGLAGKFNYRNFDSTWIYNSSYQTSSESLPAIWQ